MQLAKSYLPHSQAVVRKLIEKKNKKSGCQNKHTKIFCLSPPAFCFISTTTLIVVALLNPLMKITQQLKLERTSEGCLPTPIPLLKAMSMTESCLGPCPASF